MKKLEEISINEQEIGYCIVPAKCINKTKITNKSEYEIGAYVPKLMSEIEMKDEPYIETITGLQSEMIINKKFPIKFPEKIKLCNFIRVNPYDMSNVSPPIIANGEKFYTKFINRDIKNPTYTRENTNDVIRENDAYQISVNRKDESDDSIITYSLYLNGIEKKSGLKIKDDIFIEINEEQEEIIIKYENSNFKVTKNKIEMKSDEIQLEGNNEINMRAKTLNLNGKVNINGSLLVNNRTLEQIIDARCASH